LTRELQKRALVEVAHQVELARKEEAWKLKPTGKAALELQERTVAIQETLETRMVGMERVMEDMHATLQLVHSNAAALPDPEPEPEDDPELEPEEKPASPGLQLLPDGESTTAYLKDGQDIAAIAGLHDRMEVFEGKVDARMNGVDKTLKEISQQLSEVFKLAKEMKQELSEDDEEGLLDEDAVHAQMEISERLLMAKKDRELEELRNHVAELQTTVRVVRGMGGDTGDDAP